MDVRIRGSGWRCLKERTLAMAADLTHGGWTMLELMRYQVRLPAWVTLKHRGRPPERALQPATAEAARPRLRGVVPSDSIFAWKFATEPEGMIAFTR
jgi:hypothetical protein